MALGEQIVHILKSYVLKLYTIGFAILLFVMIIWGIHGYLTSAYSNAKRARSAGDIALATQLFAEAVREDTRSSSFDALLALMKMDEFCAMEELIDLIDMPDLNWIVGEDRERMCNVIRQRTDGTTADSLPLDPHASQDIRAEQKQQWQAWLAKAKEQYSWQNGKFVPKEQE